MFFKHITIRNDNLFEIGAKIVLIGNEKELTGIYLADQRCIKLPKAYGECINNDGLTLFQNVEEQLKDYFNAKIDKFDLPYSIAGTPFQKKVLRTLIEVPYGTTISYKNLAKKISSSEPTRAVANVLSSNKLLFLLPCHRVIGSDGALKGYAGGLEMKGKLLQGEKHFRLGQICI